MHNFLSTLTNTAHYLLHGTPSDKWQRAMYHMHAPCSPWRSWVKILH